MASESGFSPEKIQELQVLEQNLQNLSLQRQAFDFELSESEHALEELSNSKGEVFKIVGQIMVKSEKNALKDELEKKIKLLSLRVKTFESQEKEFSERADAIREALTKKGQSK